MNVLVACEFSGVARRAFAKRGHAVWSCDLLPAVDGAILHYQGDVRTLLAINERERFFDLMIAHPPCTYLSVSGQHWNKRRPERARMTQEALDFVRMLLGQPIPKIALENPVGVISTHIRKPDQIIQPYQFGEDASKQTCLWLKGLPKLVPTKYVEPRVVNGKKRWANQTDSGQNRLGPSPNRGQLRSITYEGIAEAMAAQWS